MYTTVNTEVEILQVCFSELVADSKMGSFNSSSFTLWKLLASRLLIKQLINPTPSSCFFKKLTLELSMNTLYVKKKAMRMRLESQSIFGNMESGQSAVLPVEEVIPHFLFLLLFVFITDVVLKEVMFFNLHLMGTQIVWFQK